MTFVRPLRLLAVGLLLLAGCKKTPEDDAAAAEEETASGSEAPLALEVVGASVTRGDLLLSVNATGQISSEAIANVSAETGGTVQEVLVKPGDQVRQGQVLARLETTLLDLSVNQAKATLATARMNFASAMQDDTISKRRPTPEREEQLRAAAGIGSAEVGLQRAQYDRDHAIVTAPYDGVIERVGVVPGDRIGSGKEIAQIVDLKHLRIDARVMEHDIASLRVGADAQITIGAVAGEPVRGKISAVLPLVDSIGKFGRASIRFEGNGVIRPGMFATVRLEATRLPNQIMVPVAAVVERTGRPLVFVVHDNIAEWLYIMPGRKNADYIAILPDTSTGIVPLKPGDTVLVAGHRTLTHQAPVKLVAKRGDDRR